MKFRFHINKSLRTDQPLPPLSEWGSAPLGLTGTPLPWTLGATPSRIITGASSLSPKTTEYLYVEHPFIFGRSYQLSFGITHVDNTGFPQNPRTLTITIQDQNDGILATQSYSTLVGLNNVVFNFTAGISYSRIGIRFNSGSGRTMTAESVAVSVTEYEFHEAYINEPDGWRDSTLKLERDKLFHSLIEHFEGSFIFYGNNGRINGGYHFLKDWDAQDGPDADITLVIEYSDNNVDFYEIFTGQLDMSLAEWMIDHKVRIPIIKDNFWATFMNRKETPVNLIATEDLDDEEVEELVDDISIDLPSQKIRYNGDYNWLDTFTYYEDEDLDFAIVAQLDWDETIVDDLRKFNLPRALIAIGDNVIWDVVTGIFEAPWDGEYTFNIRLESAYYDPDDDLWVPSASTPTAPTFRVGIVGTGPSDPGFGSPDPDTVFTNENVTYGADEITVSTYTKTLTLFKGQQVAIWGRPGVGIPTEYPENLTVFGERRLTWSDVRLATIGTIVLSGEQTIDGVMTSADRVLVKNQGDPSQNGIYVSGAGAWTRATDVDSSVEMINAAVYVTEGDTNAESGWRQAMDEVEIGVTSNNWVYIIPNDERLRPYPGAEVDNHLTITADTIFRKTKTAGFLLHDVAAAILAHYGLGQVKPFYSKVLGSDRTLARQYEENGCFWPYGLTRGLQLRGYSLAEKSFSMSFMEWWQGADPIFNLGLGYEFYPGETIIPVEAVVEDLASWSDATAGDYVGFWTYTSPSVPHVSVNGGGNDSGYTKGDCATATGETYEFTFELEIYDTGVSGELTDVTVAILDSSDNELATQTFNYVTAGVKTEVFTLSPSANGAFVALRITNNTPIDTKSYQLNVFEATDSPDPIVFEPETRIRVEKREYFYDPEPVVYLSNIRNITRRYDTEKIYKKILVGYKTWKTEDISGIDDPQTKHTYATQLKKTGEEIEVLSEFIAASLAVEQARRQSIDKSTDYQFDDSTFIIALNTEEESVSPDSFVPETDENFTVINNLLNSETRYNIRLTPARSFLRHLNWLNVGLQSYVGSLYRFTRGEGNYDVETAMLSTCDEEDYGGELLGEGYNLTVTNDAIHTAYYYEIEYKLSLSEYRAIAANKNKAIGVSLTDFAHIPLLIDTLAYQMAKGELQVSGWTKEYWDITNVLGLPPTQDCTILIPCENPITDELFNELADDEGNCIVWAL